MKNMTTLNIKTEIFLECEGKLPSPFTKKNLLNAIEIFIQSAQNWSKPKTPWAEVTIFLIHDKTSAELNKSIMNHDGATDVITQRYEPIPGEKQGLIGELYVNLDQAQRVAEKYSRTTFEREVLLYIAHGCDHLTDADDSTPEERRAMRRRDSAWTKKALQSCNFN